MAREYTRNITLVRNDRGIYSLDTVMGCASGMALNEKGCYGDCYAARYSKKYGYDFSKNVLRYFKDEKHIKSIIRNINNIDIGFIRIGTSGDPSENWEHTLDILDKIKDCDKDIVIITKHWNNLSFDQLNELKKYKVTVNSSISAMYRSEIMQNGLLQYERLKPFCNSVLRVVTCDFNTENTIGADMAKIQEDITNSYEYIDTIFRVSKNNDLVKMGIINIKEVKFLGKKCNVSKMNKKSFFGKCEKCPEQCGIKR